MGTCEPGNLQVGDILSRTSYMEVIAVPGGGVAQVRNRDGLIWSISSGILRAEAVSSTQYRWTQHVSLTELVRVLVEEARDSAFTVTFACKKDPAELAGDVQRLAADAAAGHLTQKKLKSELLEGRIRTMRVRLLKSTNHLGRSVVELLDVPKDAPGGTVRQVDHRTLKAIVLRQGRYVLHGWDPERPDAPAPRRPAKRPRAPSESEPSSETSEPEDEPAPPPRREARRTRSGRMSRPPRQ